MISLRIFAYGIPSACCVETTTVWTRTGFPPSYSTVTCDFPSGRSHEMSPFSRAYERRSTSRCARWIGSGINSFVSRHA